MSRILNAKLIRPSLLVRAARLWAESYEMSQLQFIGLSHIGQLPLAERVRSLMSEERCENDARKSRATHYSSAHHIEILGALIAELRSLRHANTLV